MTKNEIRLNYEGTVECKIRVYRHEPRFEQDIYHRIALHYMDTEHKSAVSPKSTILNKYGVNIKENVYTQHINGIYQWLPKSELELSLVFHRSILDLD